MTTTLERPLEQTTVDRWTSPGVETGHEDWLPTREAETGTKPTRSIPLNWLTLLGAVVAAIAIGALGYALGVQSQSSTIAGLEDRVGSLAAVASYDTSLAMEHLAQAPDGWTGATVSEPVASTAADYSLAREHLTQAPTTSDYSLAREHLTQAPTTADYSLAREHLTQAP